MSSPALSLYAALMTLTESGDTFYYQDFNLDGLTYRIFNYRLSSYTEFMQPYALEARGHMFEVDDQGRFIRIAAWPQEKFFNFNENPSTMGLDLSQIKSIEVKADGSLMSTYMHNGELRLKSRGSLFSEQALDAMAWLSYRDDEIRRFREALHTATAAGWTVNLEWVSPKNRIVLGYMEPNLIVLNARSTYDGMYLTFDEPERFDEVLPLSEINYNAPVELEGITPQEFVLGIPKMDQDIEGFVVRLNSGQCFKVKTEKYMSLHHAKDSINNPRRLFEAVVDEGVDDLRSMFAGDVLAIKQIDEMQEKVTRLYNGMVKTVEEFHAANKHLDRKDYAIKGREKENLDQLYFGLAISKYLERPVDYKGFIKSKYKELGFRDEKVITNE